METTIHPQTTQHTPAASRTPFMGSGFPGPITAGVSLIAAPVLGVLGSALGIGIYHYKGSDMITAMAQHHARTIAAINIAVTGVVLMVFAVTVLAKCICDSQPRLGRLAGVLTVIGLAGPLYFQGMYWGASFLTAPRWQSAGAHLMDGTQVLPSTIINVSGPALVIGFVLLAVGTARAGVFPRWRAVTLGMAALLPIGFISGYIAVAAIGFALASLALVPLGIAILRRGDAR